MSRFLRWIVALALSGALLYVVLPIIIAAYLAATIMNVVGVPSELRLAGLIVGTLVGAPAIRQMLVSLFLGMGR
jgi:hypothetical protein